MKHRLERLAELGYTVSQADFEPSNETEIRNELAYVNSELALALIELL